MTGAGGLDIQTAVGGDKKRKKVTNNASTDMASEINRNTMSILKVFQFVIIHMQGSALVGLLVLFCCSNLLSLLLNYSQ